MLHARAIKSVPYCNRCLWDLLSNVFTFRRHYSQSCGHSQSLFWYHSKRKCWYALNYFLLPLVGTSTLSFQQLPLCAQRELTTGQTFFYQPTDPRLFLVLLYTYGPIYIFYAIRYYACPSYGGKSTPAHCSTPTVLYGLSINNDYAILNVSW